MDAIDTPALIIDEACVQRNIAGMAEYARQHHLRFAPHTKTHKSRYFAELQVTAGVDMLSVAKVSEAEALADCHDALFLAYPPVDAHRAQRLVALAETHHIRCAVDDPAPLALLEEALAPYPDRRIEVIVDVDMGAHRTGVQDLDAILALQRAIIASPQLDPVGIMFFAGHLGMPPAEQSGPLAEIDKRLKPIVAALRECGIASPIISGGSTPTAYRSHLITQVNEIRPGTYIFNDMNGVHGGFNDLDECAARIRSTVISSAVPGQIVLDAGSKTLTSDGCYTKPDSGHGYICEYPEAKIIKLSEEHAQVDISGCERPPVFGEIVHVIPNHICPCINLADRVFLQATDGSYRPLPVDARGCLV